MPSRGEVYSTETRRPSIHPLLELLVGASVQSIRASWVCRVGAKFTGATETKQHSIHSLLELQVGASVQSIRAASDRYMAVYCGETSFEGK